MQSATAAISKNYQQSLLPYAFFLLMHATVMELCTAGDLAKLLKAREGKPLPEQHILFLFVQICLALQYTHEAGVLHRDLKAGNCMLTTPASSSHSSSSSIQSDYANMPLLKLGDFGVAKVSSAVPAATVAAAFKDVAKPSMHHTP
jgi:serine/threonine protein kinase